MMRVLHADYCENKSMGTPNFAPRLFGDMALRQLGVGADTKLICSRIKLYPSVDGYKDQPVEID